MDSSQRQVQQHAEFYFDLGSLACYAAAEYLIQTLPGAVHWHPVLASRLPAAPHGSPDVVGPGTSPGKHLPGTARYRQDAECEWHPSERMLPLRMPDPHPFDSTKAMLAATFAASIGRVIAFSIAAFRQAFAAGRALDDLDSVLIAGAACEMHPRAIQSALKRRAIAEQLECATEAAAAKGVSVLPAVRLHGELHTDPQRLAEAIGER